MNLDTISRPTTNDLCAVKATALVVVLVVAGAIAALVSHLPSSANNKIQGRTVGDWVRVLGTGTNSGEDPLCLRQLTTGEEPTRFTFEVPISYDRLQLKPGELGLRRLALLVDGKVTSLPDRATNGNCVLIWNAVYESPGVHHLQSQLLLADRSSRVLETLGPVMSVSSTNIFQLDEFWNAFSNSRGGVLYARLAAPIGEYEILLFDSTGGRIRSFQGAVSNGIIEEHWNLTDTAGRAVNDASITAVFRVTFPGRTSQAQTQILHRTFP